MKTVLIPSLTMAMNVDTLNASFIDTTTDIENGSVFQKGERNTDNEQVYNIVKPVTGKLNDLWMACSPEDTIITLANGEQIKPGLYDPRLFTNVAGQVFSGFKPMKGDIIKLSDTGIDDAFASGDKYIVASNNSYKFKFASEAEVTAILSAGTTVFKILNAVDYISIGNASAIGTDRVGAYLVECVQN